jgi:hypothetical protein
MTRTLLRQMRFFSTLIQQCVTADTTNEGIVWEMCCGRS